MKVFLPREFHGQRSLAGYSSWGCKESDMTEWLTFPLFHSKFKKICFKKHRDVLNGRIWWTSFMEPTWLLLGLLYVLIFIISPFTLTLLTKKWITSLYLQPQLLILFPVLVSYIQLCFWLLPVRKKGNAEQCTN